MNAEWEGRGLQDFEMGFGINFGEVIFGNIGSSRKMEPTVIGDAVNATSRLEGLTKDYGRDLLVGEAAADLVGKCFRLQFVDKVTMKGKTKPLRIYSVFAVSEGLEPQMAAYLEAYELAQASYSAGNFLEAKRSSKTVCAIRRMTYYRGCTSNAAPPPGTPIAGFGPASTSPNINRNAARLEIPAPMFRIALQAGESRNSNGADGMSDIEGKAARVAARERGPRTSFEQELNFPNKE